MRTLLLGAFLIVLNLTSLEAVAAPEEGEKLTIVEAEYVCMVNNKLFDREQIPVTVEDKIYYGCCPMCKERLEKIAQIRTSIDPVSGNQVDKASAIIGAQANRTVHYFENEQNLKKFTIKN